ncbi:hypothetical protein KY285_008349 [Solanum tuberosum]|nr:hypothetical protein KY285_008349 [Solanum tuberosum]
MYWSVCLLLQGVIGYLRLKTLLQKFVADKVPDHLLLTDGRTVVHSQSALLQDATHSPQWAMPRTAADFLSSSIGMT